MAADIDTLMHLYDEADELKRRYANLADRIEMLVLALSVATSGAFWALASDSAPKALGWVGAAISTVVTGLTLYMYTSGVQSKRKKAIFVYREIGKFLGEARGNPNMDGSDFWSRYKVYEGMVRTIPYEKEG